MDKMLAIIPARCGSKGIENKNIKPLAGHPILAYSIAAAKLAEIDNIIVSTDSQEYAEIAKKYGAKVPFIRSSKISKDNSTDYDFMFHAMEWVKDNKEICPEYWVHLRPTTPLRYPHIINSAAKIIKENPLATSLRSGHLATESPFKWFMKDSNGYFVGLDKNLSTEKINQPRQSFPDVYVPNGYVDIVRSSYVLSSPDLHGNKMLVYKTPHINEIDTNRDLQYLDYKIHKEKHPILKYLNKITS